MSPQAREGAASELGAVLSDLEYKPGLIFRSHTSAHQEIIRGRKDIFSADGTLIDQIRELVAEFAFHGGEYTYTTADGGTDVAADIRGHFFDLDAQAETKDWTDEERDLVARVMLKRAPQSPNYWLYSKAPAPKPWPRYDDTPELDIPVIADQTGVLEQAFAYEQENAKREQVLAELKVALTPTVEIAELTAA